jgi:hypothetical protein
MTRAAAARATSRKRRSECKAFFSSRSVRALYGRRSLTIEPFNSWFKQLFEVARNVWHRGLFNNRTQLLAAMFVYQSLVCHNHSLGNSNARLKCNLDTL